MISTLQNVDQFLTSLSTTQLDEKSLKQIQFGLWKNNEKK